MEERDGILWKLQRGATSSYTSQKGGYLLRKVCATAIGEPVQGWQLWRVEENYDSKLLESLSRVPFKTFTEASRAAVIDAITRR